MLQSWSFCKFLIIFLLENLEPQNIQGWKGAQEVSSQPSAQSRVSSDCSGFYSVSLAAPSVG